MVKRSSRNDSASNGFPVLHEQQFRHGLARSVGIVRTDRAGFAKNPVRPGIYLTSADIQNSGRGRQTHRTFKEVVCAQNIHFEGEPGVAPGNINGRNTGEMEDVGWTELMDERSNFVCL